MGLHFETTVETRRRAIWGCFGRAVASVVIAGAMIWAGMMGLDSMSPRPLPVDRPQFVLVEENTLGIGGGCGGFPPSVPIWRLPTAPEIRPLGLAPKKTGAEIFPPEGFSDVESLEVEFDDGDYFGWEMSSCGSFD